MGTKRVGKGWTLSPGLHRIILKAVDSSIRIQWLEVIPSD